MSSRLLALRISARAPDLALLVCLAAPAFCFVLVVKRLNNIGMNGWWSVLLLVPFANIYISVKCLICPEGYQDTKKLDMASKIIAGVFIVPFVLMLLLFLLMSIVGMLGLLPGR